METDRTAKQQRRRRRRTLGVGEPDEAAGALRLVRVHRHGGVHVAEALEDVGFVRAALDLLRGTEPERLAQIGLLPPDPCNCALIKM